MNRRGKPRQRASPRARPPVRTVRNRVATETSSGTPGEPGRGGALPIVGVGASAGGLEAFSEFLAHLPLDTGMGFVLVQHLDPQHESALTELLQRSTTLPVSEVTNNLPVAPNHVYVIPPNTNLGITAGRLVLRPRSQTRAPARSIDAFFEALAEDQHQRAIGVILSGTASDGTVGLEAIKAEGGITFAQDDSARYDSMPRSAVAAGCVDFVLPPKSIARELARIARHPAIAWAEEDRAPATTHEDEETRVESAFKKVLLLLRNHAGVDFSLYRSPTIHRRITRRMVLSRQNTLEDYARFLRGNARELDALYSDVLISVTSFFRNPDAFDVLARTIWPELLKQRRDDPVRVWVLGCSTGQEAYSLAMTFVEATERTSRMRRLQVFATDLNEALLEKARNGLYAKSVAQELTPERLRRFFVEEEGGYRVNKSLREMVVFARQNLISDPPFSRMDLVSCRNLLIYLEPALQKRLYPMFHYALKPRGYLLLGASETVGSFGELFDPVDRKNRIYVRKAAPTMGFQMLVGHDRGETPMSRPRPAGGSIGVGADPGAAADEHKAEVSAQREADRITVNQFAPPAVLVNDALHVIQFRGPTSAYLEPPSGKASFEVLRMARAGLMVPLRAALAKAKKEGKPARKERVRIEQNGDTRTINLEVIPLRNLKERSFLILFEEAESDGAATPESAGRGKKRRSPEPRGERAAGASRGGRPGRVSELEIELAETLDYLRTVQEQHEAANEELQASNEEIQSANEELQSINEELETSKEELESANEELTTVNEEMANRNADLARLNSDLNNIQTSTQQAIVLIGRNLSIRRFSLLAEKQLNLLAADVGRPIDQVRHDLELRDLGAIVTRVIDTVRAEEREVRARDGRWFSLRVRPYMTVDNKVDGAVMILVDIDSLKRTEQMIASARDYANAIIETARDPLLVLNADLRVHTANAAFYRTFKMSKSEAEGRLVFELGDHQWNIPTLRELLEEILPRDSVFDDFEVTHDFQGLGRRTMLLNARRLIDAGQPSRILLGIQDITEASSARAEARRSQARYEALINASAQIVWTTDPGGAVVEDSPSWRAFTGQTSEQREGLGWLDAVHPEDRAQTRDLWLRSVKNRDAVDTVCRLRHTSGEWRWVRVRALPVLESEGSVREWVGMSSDITERRMAEDALSKANRRKDEFLGMLAHELRSPLAAISYTIEIMRRPADAGSSAPQPARDAAALGIMERQTGQLVRLVDDLLDASRISRGIIELRRTRVDLSLVVQQAVEAMRPIVGSMKHHLEVTLPSEPLYLDADPARLAQIVGNLLHNACKFTEPGGHIWLTAERDEEWIVIRVRDTGIGMTPEQLPRVFDLFAQMDTSLERARPGLGIGLTLAKTLAQLHGGDVRASSPGLDQGSEFVVRLPVAPEIAEEAGPPAAHGHAEPLPPLRILVVDDNQDSVESLVTLLRFGGHDPHVAHDGPGAVEAAARLRPDVILMDLGLPGLSGYDAARRIRLQQGDKKPVLVALTGWGQDEFRRRSAKAGFDAHIVKPVKEALLFETIARARQQ